MHRKLSGTHFGFIRFKVNFIGGGLRLKALKRLWRSPPVSKRQI